MCVCVYRYVCIYFVSMFVSQVTAEEIKDKRAIVLELEAKNLDKKVKHSRFHYHNHSIMILFIMFICEAFGVYLVYGKCYLNKVVLPCL